MRALADRLSPPRLLHPVAWWAWGLLLALVASRTTNPFLLLIICVVVAVVVLQRKELGATDALGIFLAIALVAVGIRVVMMMLLGSSVGGRVTLFTLPQVPLPHWLAGVQLGGPVQLAGLLDALYKGLQLATVLVCVGGCNALADPRRLLRYVPATLYDAGTAIVVALTYIPQLADDAARVRRARRLRGHSGRGIRELTRLVVPVLEGSLERSIHLAASMESRGYGRVTTSRGARRRATTLTVLGLAGVLVGLFGLLGGPGPSGLGLPLVLIGAALAAAALFTGSRRDRRTPYRRDPWGGPEWIVLLGGAVPAAAVLIAGRFGHPDLVPAQVPVVLPQVPLPLVAALLVAALPGLLAPRTPRRAELEDRARAASASVPESEEPVGAESLRPRHQPVRA